MLRPALLLLALCAVPSNASLIPRNTGDGVYTAVQAAAGADLFVEVCLSCHVPNWHNDKGFYAKWEGRALADLVQYLKLEMPQTDPGTLSDEEYTAVTAYLLQLTGNPAGQAPLTIDPDALMGIRIDTLKSAR